MTRESIQIELSLYIRAENPGEVPLEIYDALYYSGHFEPIYRIQGDMVLSAYYNRDGKSDGMLSRLTRRVLKELTIEVKEKHRGVEIKVENLMPVFEEENSFYRDPKVRISTKRKTGLSRIEQSVMEQMDVLRATEEVLLKIEKLKATADARLSVTIQENEFDSASMKQLHEKLAASSVRSTSTKHMWNLDFDRNLTERLILPELTSVLKRVAD